MALTDIVQSSGWKNFMAKLYGFGASVVIIGALFKIQHWKGSGIMLTLGLSTEAIIFFFSAFEPLHEDIDWTLVYPELAGMSDPDEIENFRDVNAMEGERTIERIEDILTQSGIDDNSLKKIGNGLQKLSETSSSLADISKASVATNNFVDNLQGAAESVNSIKDTYISTSEGIKESASNLTSAYFQTAEMITRSGSEVADSYKNIANAIQSEHQTISQGSKTHEDQLEILNKNLSALNAVYELQIKGSNEQMKGSQEVYTGLQAMIKNLKESIDETNRYKDEIVKLKENLSSLNSIYGSMLSSMNVLTNK